MLTGHAVVSFLRRREEEGCTLYLCSDPQPCNSTQGSLPRLLVWQTYTNRAFTSSGLFQYSALSWICILQFSSSHYSEPCAICWPRAQPWNLTWAGKPCCPQAAGIQGCPSQLCLLKAFFIALNNFKLALWFLSFCETKFLRKSSMQKVGKLDKLIWQTGTTDFYSSVLPQIDFLMI